MAKVGAKESKEKKWKDKERKKREMQIKDYKKEVEKLNPRFAHLPYQLGSAINHNTPRCYVDQESGISKIWRLAPRLCSSSLQSPWLAVLPRQEINTTRRIYLLKTGYCIYLEFDDDSEWGFTVQRLADDGVPSLLGVFPAQLPEHFGGRAVVRAHYDQGALPGNRRAQWRTNYNWRFQRGCAIIGPKSSSYEQFRFTNAIACGGKFYALSLQGTLAVIDIEDPPALPLRAIMSIPAGVKRAIPSTCSSKGFREYLGELDGEVLLVLLVSRTSMNVVDDVEVFRLDLTIKVGWVKIESLGDRTIFVGGKNCTVLPASEIIRFDFAKNCIYFNLGTGTRWWVFDVGSRSISPFQE